MDYLGCSATVVTTNPHSLADVLGSIAQIGKAVGRGRQAEALIAGLCARLAAVAADVAGRTRPRAAVLEWTDPPFAPGHWVPEMVELAGGISVLGAAGVRSVPTTWEVIGRAKPDVIIMRVRLGRQHSTGAPAGGPAHTAAGIPVWAVDADPSFARPGPRLVDGIEALSAVPHDGRQARPAYRRPRVLS